MVADVERAVGADDQVDGLGEAGGEVGHLFAAGAEPDDALRLGKSAPQGHEQAIVVAGELVVQVGSDARRRRVSDEGM